MLDLRLLLMRSLGQILWVLARGKGYKESFVSQIKGRNSTAVSVLEIFQATPLHSWLYQQQRDSRRGNSLFSILDLGGGQWRVVKENLPLAKSQGAYLSNRFPVFEAQSKDRAYGIQGKEKRIPAYRPGDRWLSLTLITDLNKLRN